MHASNQVPEWNYTSLMNPQFQIQCNPGDEQQIGFLSMLILVWSYFLPMCNGSFPRLWNPGFHPANASQLTLPNSSSRSMASFWVHRSPVLLACFTYIYVYIYPEWLDPQHAASVSASLVILSSFTAILPFTAILKSFPLQRSCHPSLYCNPWIHFFTTITAILKSF